MLANKTLLTASNLNSAYISKTDTNAQSINSNLTISGGALTLKNSLITDNANSAYMRIDPQGNNVIIYDGVNNQRLDVYSSSGSESTYLTTINGTKSFGQIDVSSAIDHLEINTNSQKPITLGGVLSIISGNNFNLVGNSSNDAGDIVFQQNNGTEIARIYSSGTDQLNLSTGTNTDAQIYITDSATTITNALTVSGTVNIKGTSSLLFSDYGGGFYMSDSTWIRTTGNKSFYHNSGNMRTDGTLQVGNAGATLNVDSGGNFNYRSGALFANTSNQVGVGTASPRNKFDVQGGAVTIGTNLQTTTTFTDGTLTVGDTTRSYSGNNNGMGWGTNGDTVTLQAKDYSTIAFLQYNTRLDYIRGGAGSIDLGYDGGWGRSNILFTNGIWNNSGNVGVGTASPSYPVHVKKNGTGTALYVENTTGTNDTLIELNAGGDSSHMIIQTNEISTTTGDLWIQNTGGHNLYLNATGGNTGIGTTQPLQKLDVSGGGIRAGAIYTPNSYLGFLTDSSGALPIKAGSLAITNSYSNSAPSNGLYVQGAVGIGTTSPASMFQVNETSMSMYTINDHVYLQKIGGTQYPYLGFVDSGGTRGGFIGWGTIGSHIDFALENNNNLYINPTNGTNKVGIGTPNPSQTLDVVGVIQSNSQYISNSNNDIFQALGTGNTVKTFRYDNSNLRFWNAGSGEIMTLTQNTRVGIGQPNPSYTLDVTGDIRTTTAFRATTNNAQSLYVGSNSAIWDVNTANTMGIYGQQNTAIGALKLGSTGPTLFGSGGVLGIGTTVPWTSMALDVNGSIRVAGGKGIYSGYNNGYILNDHNNGNVSVNATNATSGNLYLGYNNTAHVYLATNLTTTSNTNIIDTSGKLYYQGNDTDSRYLNSTGDTLNGNLVFGGNSNYGIYGDSANWTRIDPNGQRFIMPIPSSRVTNGDLILSVEDTGNSWNQLFKLTASGDLTAKSISITGNIWMNNQAINSASKITGYYGTIARSVDEWLRLNDDGSHASGVYFGSSLVRTDGQLQIGSNGANASITTTQATLNIPVTVNAGNSGNQVQIGNTRYYAVSGGTTNGDGIYGSNNLHIGAENSLDFWSESGNINFYTGTQGTGYTNALTISSGGVVNIGGNPVKTYTAQPSPTDYISISSSGWYNIAHNPNGDRASGTFTLEDVSISKHSLVKFETAFAFGVGSTFSMFFTQNYRAGAKVITCLRVVYNGSSEYFLQAYVNLSAGATAILRTILENNHWDSGWQLMNWTAGGIPTGYNYDSYDITAFDRKPNVWTGGGSPPATGAGVGDVYIQY